MNPRINPFRTPWLFAVLALLWSMQAHAVPEPLNPNDITRGTLLFQNDQGVAESVPLVKTEIKTEITGQIARTHIHQYFRNPGNRWIEALYLFPLPSDAAVDQMRMSVGERIIEGQIQEREKAKATYEKAKHEGKRAALVEQDRPNLFSTSVANIPPGGDVIITLEYQQSIEWRDGRFSLRIPMAMTPRYKPQQTHEQSLEGSLSLTNGWSILPDERPHKLTLDADGATAEKTTSIDIVLRPGFEVKSVTSPYHDIISQASDDGSYAIRLADVMVPADRDFVLHWQAADTQGPTAAFFSESTTQGDYGLLSLLPPTVGSWEIPSREVIFVIDTSGSMGGQSIRAARQALMAGIDGLGIDDTFNIIEFNSDAYALFNRPQAAQGNALHRAGSFIRQLEAGGGTEMEDALEMALKMPGDQNRFQQVIFITDGSVGNERELFAKIHRDLGHRRLFTIAIGSAPNSYFMEESARAGRGTYTYIANPEMAEEAMSTLFDKISRPALTNIRVSGYGLSEITPQTVPDLYAGEPLTIAMKLHPGLKRVTISGLLGGSEWQQSAVIEPVSSQAGISIDWARKMIAQWQRESFKGVSIDKVRQEILALALEHHLVSDYTSLVAVDVTPVRVKDDMLKTLEVPPTPPHGLKIQLAQSASGYQLVLLTGLLLALASLLLLHGRNREMHSGV